LILASLLLVAAMHTPEECISGKGATSVEYAGKTYRFAFADCREEFLSDPERYAQLYDALLELQAAGRVVERAPAASLVPS